MTFEYKLLSPGLHPTADAAIEWFVKDWGIKKSRVEVEAPFDSDIILRPTFVVQMDDGHLLCIEVSENIYSNTLDTVVLRCRDKGLPVKLVVAAPKDIKDVDYSKKIKDAKRNGVGVLEVDATSGSFVQIPLSLSLTGVRPLQLTDFPPRYRLPLQHAQQMFRDGEPSKACSLVYDELEGVCRVFAKKCAQKRLWTSWQIKTRHVALGEFDDLDQCGLGSIQSTCEKDYQFIGCPRHRDHGASQRVRTQAEKAERAHQT